MNRLQKKCLIATTGLHLLLVLVLLFGSAFFTHHEKPDDTQLLDVIPANLIDAAFNSGVKNAQVPAPTPPTPAPPKAVVTPPTPPPPQPTPAPTLMQRVEKIFTPEPKLLPPDEPTEPAPKPTPHKIKVDLTPVKRITPKVTPDTSDADAREAAKEAKQRARAIAAAARAIKANASSATDVDTMPGTGSVSYASYGSAIKSIYDQAWILPGNVNYGNASAKIKVVISRDGQVISSRIVESSGNSALDDSAQRALDRVTEVPPFPDGDTSREHTYTFSFNPLTKQTSE